jgi:hypothetical protein
VGRRQSLTFPPGISSLVARGRVAGASLTISGRPTAPGDYQVGLNVFDQGDGAGVHYGIHVCAS